MNSTRWPPGVRTNARAAPHGRRCSSGSKPASRRRANAAVPVLGHHGDVARPAATTGSSVNRKWICVPVALHPRPRSRRAAAGGSTRSKPSSARTRARPARPPRRSSTDTCWRLTAPKLPAMGTDKQGDLLWEPSEERIERATMTRYMGWLEDERGLEFDDYAALWEWSTDDLEAFWGSLWEFFDVQAEYDEVLPDRSMPGAHVVQRRRALLSRAHLPRPPGRPRGAPPRLRAARPGRVDVGRAARARPRACAPACRRWASSAATASSPTCRTSPRRSPRSSRPPRSARCGRAARPTSARARWSTASPRSSRRCCCASTATATAARTTTAAS